MTLATTALVYGIGASVFSQRVGRYAAALCWLSPSLMFFNFLMLTETVFTFLLTGFLYLTVRLVRTPNAGFAIGAGAALGLAALTRSILWPAPLLVCPLVGLVVRAPRAQRILLPALVLAGYAVVVTPWAIRNTRLQGVLTVVDTMGGLNLRMGNYDHTPADRMWDAVALTGEKNWSYELPKDLPGAHVTEGQKDKWAQRKAIEYVIAHPLITAERSLIKFADFWGLEREFVAGVQKGLFAPPKWFTAVAGLALLLVFPAVALAAAVGIWFAVPEDRRMHIVLLLPVVLIAGVHTIVFGHSRYHVPLFPILALYAAAVFVEAGWKLWRLNRLSFAGAAVCALTLVFIWTRQILITDLERIRAFISHAV
jgi:4-amino-4-deoxy-L-arabinose transferase-like glycosyltransferase